MNEKFLYRFVLSATVLLAVPCLGTRSAPAQSTQGPGGRHFPPAEVPGGTPPAGQRPPLQAPTARPPLAQQDSIQGPGKKTPAGEQFFIVASIDLQKSQMLLKRPTEVTLLARVDDKTQFLDETGQPIKLSNLRAGDTVWVNLSNGSSGATATRVRKGQMALADLHRYYLDYPEIK
jgi:hypothetical protein